MEQEVETRRALLRRQAHTPSAELKELPACWPQLPVQEGGEPELFRGWELEQRLGQGDGPRGES